jgi:hypothetical protein
MNGTCQYTTKQVKLELTEEGQQAESGLLYFSWLYWLCIVDALLLLLLFFQTQGLVLH